MPIQPNQSQEILRYWLACVRQEEALNARPVARRPPTHMPPVDLRDPSDGLPYVRLDRALTLLTRAEPRWLGPFDPPTAAFFERWLKGRYRAEFAASRGRPEQVQAAWFVGWPVVHFDRRGELAPVLRFPVEVSFQTAADTLWKPPSYGERKAGKLPPLPSTLRLAAQPPDDDEPPFSVDPLLLSRTLAVTDEELATLFEALDQLPAEGAAQAAIAAVVRCLDPDSEGLPDGAPAAELMTRLCAAVQRRLPERGAKVYPVGLLYDGSAAYATWHLQRDMAELLRRPPGRAPWGQGTALWSYLSQQPPEPGWGGLEAVQHPRGLTETQRRVAERALGSTLTAAQGPPGTGKTELIGALAAHGLAARALALAGGGEMPDDITVVTSTNNRAVDNALDPLADEIPRDRLPVALRVGSQPVVGQVTADTLGRVLTWLDGQQGQADAQETYDAALARLRAAGDALADRTRPQTEYQQRKAQLAKVTARLAELPGADVDLDAGPGGAELSAALHAAHAMQRRLELVQDALVPGDIGALKDALRRVKRMEAKALPRLRKALEIVDGVFEVGLPPPLGAKLPVEEQVDAWENATGEALTAIEALQDRLVRQKAARKAAHRRLALEAERDDLAALVADAPPPADQAEIDGLAHAVYERAIVVRERWAALRADQLRPVVARALAVALQARSLKRLFEKSPEVETWLRRLFPVWGCTLLSLGNTFPPQPACLDRVVVDEAGQCHPAYAVSALMRAHRALVVGDVHQLEPVVQLTPTDEKRAQRQAKLTLPPEAIEPFRIAATGGASAQALADAALGDQRLALTDHFRCQPEIIALSDRLCGYRLHVHTPVRSLTQYVPLLSAPVVFAPVRGQQSRVRGSWINEAEIRATLTLLNHLGRGGIPPDEVAVITPYAAQLDALRIALRELGIPHGEQGGVATGTVHRFQGGERTVVIFSTVVTRTQSLRFIDQRVNLVNVAISRAKDHLVVVGDPEVLAQGKHTKVLVEGATLLG